MATISCSGPGELLALLPYQLGYHPRDAVVVVGLDGSRLAFLERLDLPPADALTEAVASLTAPLRRERPESVLLVGYESLPAESVPLLDLLALECATQGIDVLDAWVVRDERWLSLRCAKPCCSGAGTPLPDPTRTPGVAEFVGMGVAPLADREAVDALVRPDPVAAATTLDALAPVGDPDDVVAAWRRLTEPHGDAGTGDVLTAGEVAVLAASLTDLAWRDAVIGRLCPGSLPAGASPPDTGRRVVAAVPDRPWADLADGHERAAACQRLRARMLAVARRVPDEVAAPFLVVVAHLAWWSGDGTLARVALDRALLADPGYRLARLLARMVDLGLRTARAPEP